VVITKLPLYLSRRTVLPSTEKESWILLSWSERSIWFSCDGCLQRPLCSTPLVFVGLQLDSEEEAGVPLIFSSPESFFFQPSFFEMERDPSPAGLNQKMENPVRKTGADWLWLPGTGLSSWNLPETYPNETGLNSWASPVLLLVHVKTPPVIPRSNRAHLSIASRNSLMLMRSRSFTPSFSSGETTALK